MAVEQDVVAGQAKVGIVICYQEGTAPVLEACLSSIQRHTDLSKCRVVVLSRHFDDEAMWVKGRSPFVEFVEKDIGKPSGVSSRVHGALLDSYLPSGVKEEFVMTMDSDCFPVADDWLEGLLAMMDAGARVVGILHPWSPPPKNMDRRRIEWRVRSQHCWDTTHVACQMLRIEDLKELGVAYNVGDDTGLLVPMEAKKRGWKIDGYRVSRCAKPSSPANASGGVQGEQCGDPEFNRYACLVFGDKVYHHGGFTRTAAFGDKPVFEAAFAWVKEKIMDDRGAEFLLDDAFSYRFKFDREEQIAAEKMSRLFGLT